MNMKISNPIYGGVWCGWLGYSVRKKFLCAVIMKKKLLWHVRYGKTGSRLVEMAISYEKDVKSM